MLTYSALRRRGIQHLEQMTGRSWTDFNVHDPGITLLEALCYALTDLSYRTDYDVADLLADGGGDPYASLHAPSDILTTHAVTEDDLRRLVLDVEGVKNAWIEDVEEILDGARTPILGLYRVVLEASAEREGIHVRREVGRRLHKNRGLCEDFVDIIVLDPLKVRVDTTIEIGRVDDPAVTYAQILDAIAEVISPTIPFTTLADRAAKGARVDEIFEGPLLESGFITDEALARAYRREAIHSSDIVHAVMDVPGVRAVTEIILRAGDSSDTWSLEIPSDRSPRLDRAFSQITLRSAGLPVAIGAPAPAPRPPPRVKVGPGAGIQSPAWRDRRVSVYHSAQHHLPDLYGIGEVGLPESAALERKGRAKQLKAYLMFFDQLMASYLSQLAHVKDLFSLHPAPGGAPPRSYFSQIVDEPSLGLSEVATVTPDALAAMSEEPADALARKHRFLNHLLARFSEDLNTRYTAAGGDDPGASEELIGQKQRFLGEYPRISGTRGTAFDTLGPWGQANPSGLEERVRFKLGLFEEDGETLIIVEHILTRPGQLHQFDWILDKLPPNVGDPYSLKLSFVLPGTKGRFGNQVNGAYPFREVVEQTLRGQTPAHIGTYVLWLDATETRADTNLTDWDAFLKEHSEWRRRTREHWASKLGISLGLDPRRRATIPALPLVPGYTALTGNEPLLAAYGTQVATQVDGTQEGNAAYSLIRAADKATISIAPTLGTGKTIFITSEPLKEDLVIRVQVERLFDDTILLDAVLTVKVRANPAALVEATGSPLVNPEASTSITIHNTQTSVVYSVYARPLDDEELFQPEDGPHIDVPVTAVPGISTEATLRAPPPPTEAWGAYGYTLLAGPVAGNGADRQIALGVVAFNRLVVVRAHKDHGATPPEATDVQVTQAVALTTRPGSAPNLELVKLTNNAISVTGGEPGVFYYLLDPTTNAVLGRPAYFHRKDEAEPAKNRGLGSLRIGRDFSVARGPVPAGVDRAGAAPLSPIVSVSAVPASNTVKVMALRARTHVPWAQARTMTLKVPA